MILNRRSISRVKHLPRYREVANIFIKYGFGSMYDRVNLPFWKKHSKGKNVDGSAEQSNSARRLRAAFEELGPTYIKLGQLLSTRADLLSAEFIEELEHLQDDVPPFAFEEVMKICHEEGINIDDNFKYISREPLAAASIGQVHEAVLVSGEKVVIKVKRPGIDDIVKTDLEILEEIAVLLERRSEWIRFHKGSEVIKELGEALLNELDFEKEARNIDIFYKNFKNEDTVIIPAVYWEYSGKNMITMEYVEGVKISDFASLKKHNYDEGKIAQNIVKALYLQVYKHGFFHADPHPGNMAVSSGERIIFYDFGQVGIVDEFERDKYVTLIIGMMNYDVTGVTRAFLDIAAETRHVNVEELRRDVAQLARKYYGMPLAQINIGQALSELVDLSVEYQMRLPPELSLLVKMLMTIERTVSGLDPQISLIDIAEPLGRKALLERYSGKKVIHDIGDIMMDYGNVIKTMPRELSSLLKKLDEGQFTIKMEHQRLEKLNVRLDLIFNRLSLAIILASIIIGSSLILNSSGSSIMASIPMAELGFIFALILGFFLAYSILKSGRF